MVLGYVNSADIGGISKTFIDADANVENLAKSYDQIGIITSPRGRILFGPANVWSKGDHKNIYQKKLQLKAASFAAMTDKLITLNFVVES